MRAIQPWQRSPLAIILKHDLAVARANLLKKAKAKPRMDKAKATTMMCEGPTTMMCEGLWGQMLKAKAMIPLMETVMTVMDWQ